MTRYKIRKSIFNSLNFKTWSYFMLFSLSILLLLLFTQLFLLEPFYKATLKKDIISLNKSIYDITISNLEDDVKTGEINKITASNNACILIYNATTTDSKSSDALGETGCALYAQGTVNPSIIDNMAKQRSTTYFVDDYAIDYTNQEVMIYGEKYIINNEMIYIISNFALQSMDNIIRTTQNQFFVIAIILLFLSIVISMLFSGLITKPILNIKNEATKLSQGNYDLSFNKSYINEVDELGETLEIAAVELSNIDETRKELLANVSHDLKTPLTMIKAYAEMIKDISGSNKQKRNEHLDIIINETDNLNILVSDMLDLSKLQAKATKLEMQPFDLTTNIIDTAAKFNTIAKREGVEIVVDCEPELVAIGDKNKINEVIYNFISNALKHYGNDKKIIVKAYLVNLFTIRVEVTDHGPGIDDNTLPYIWDRYYKNDKKYQRAQSGSGLGLAICKAILEQHGCEYGVNTKLNEGSTFYFELKNAESENTSF